MSDFKAMVRLLEDDALHEMRDAVEEELKRRAVPSIKELMDEFNRQMQERAAQEERRLRMEQYESMWERWRK